MNIKEFAKLANVSISTVSKIMNHKDESISPATRDRILSLAKKYNYIPYASVKRSGSRTMTIGVLASCSRISDGTLSGIIKAAGEQGYLVTVCGQDPLENPDGTARHIESLLSRGVSGLLWEPLSRELLGSDLLQEAGIPCLTFGCFSRDNVCIPYDALGCKAAEKLLELGHKEIACLAPAQGELADFTKGYKTCLFEHNLPLDCDLLFPSVTNSLLSKITSRAVTSAICSDALDCLKLCAKLSSLHCGIPRDFSVITLLDDLRLLSGHAGLSALPVPHEAFGCYLGEEIIHLIEDSPKPVRAFTFSPELTSKGSIAPPAGEQSKKILVIGSINIDNYFNVSSLPRSGKTVSSSLSSVSVGGKGMNQAVGIAKLGQKAALIGHTGDDIPSDTVFSVLRAHDIIDSGVFRCPDYPTGQGYIFIQPDGESMISIMSGANQSMTGKDILDNARLFEDASFCLIQTEIPMAAVRAGLELAKKHGITTLLKPAACGSLDAALLPYIDILVPNKNELAELCPQKGSLEQMADYFLDRGVGHMIITLGEKGCYIKDSSISCRIPAADFPAVDSTGACDAFMSALAAYLQYGYDLVSAARIATYAAGFSVSRIGVIPSLISRTSLEVYLRQKEPYLLKS